MPIIITDRKLNQNPSLSALPSNCNYRLIDKGLLQYEASVAGCAERYGHGETSHTIHVWWARRPHTAMRALVFAALCKNTSENAEKLLSELGLSTLISDRVVNKARTFLSDQYESPPRILDMFGGGGTIPFESLNLGAETYAIDANELSVFIQKCNLVYSQKTPSEKNIQLLLNKSGERILNQLRKETGPLYPLRKPRSVFNDNGNVFGYLWTYSKLCQECGYKYYMIKRPWLSKKKGKSIAFTVSDDEAGQMLSIETVPEDYKYPSVWINRNRITRCPKCGNKEHNADIRKCIDQVTGMIRSAAKGKGKLFIPTLEDAVPSDDLIKQIESEALEYLETVLPKSELPVWSGIINPALYGIQTHADFMNTRQRAVLVLLIKCLYDEYQRLIESESKSTARYTISLLASLIDQMVDWNSRLSMWIPQNEQVGRGFCGPGVSMLWDYAEIDPLSSGPSNLQGKLKRIIKGSASIKRFTNKSFVSHGYAQALPFDDNYFDGIVTDPPYYDNIYYGALADFFFAWKRLLLQKIDPELFKSETTDVSKELVASTKRNGTPVKAHEVYCHQLKLAIKEAARVLKPDGVFCFIYSHSSLNGWEALIRAYRPSTFIITGVQPLSIERKDRPRAITSKAVNTCIAFVIRKTSEAKQSEPWQNITHKIENICDSEYLPNLIEWGWCDHDAALSVFAHGIGLLANVRQVDGKSDIETLDIIEQIIREKVASFKIIKRNSL